MTNKHIGITGHRPDKLGGWNNIAAHEKVYDYLKKIIVQAAMNEPIELNIGMALGIDTWAAQICIDEKIPFNAIMPFRGFDRIWKQPEQDYLQELLLSAQSKIYLYDIPPDLRKSYLERNKSIVNLSDEVWAFWNGDLKTGTGYTLNYADNRNKPVLCFNTDNIIK